METSKVKSKASIMDIRQCPEYAKHLELLGWKIEKVDGCQIFIRQFPLIGSFIKIQRSKNIPPVEKIFALVKKYRAFQVCIEPLQRDSQVARQLVSKYGFRLARSPSLPSKTLHLNLTVSEDQIFANFSSSKRRDIRRAIRDNIFVKESKNIDNFIVLKESQNRLSGKILRVDKGFRALWQVFRPKKAALLLAYSPDLPDSLDPDIPLAGLLVLFHDQIAYYYQAASTREGNKLAAPSLLVWETLKLSKKKGCKIFDFEGIYDSRFPQKSWLGFTRFKRGFGGKEITYPPPLVKTSFLWYK